MNTLDPKQMTFLIVDDMDNMRRSIRAMLKLIQFGKIHIEAVNGKEAWEILQAGTQRFDFVISDWNMPKMNGIELLNLVRSSKELRDIPFLMITSEANMGIVAEAAEQDVDAYLTKPFVTATLEQKIYELLHNISNPSKLSQLLKKSLYWQEKGQIDKAIACAKMATELNKRSSRPSRELGILYLKKNDLTSAAACFKAATELNRLDVPSYHYLGQIKLKLGETDKAITYFTKALELSPRHTDRAFKVATLLLNKNKKPEAEKILTSILRNSHGNIDLVEDVADTCHEHGLYALATKAYKTVLTEAPDRDYLNKKLGINLYKGGDIQDAIDVLEKIAQKFPTDIELMLTIAQAYLDVKVRMRADKWATRAARIDPKNKEAQKILDQCM